MFHLSLVALTQSFKHSAYQSDILLVAFQREKTINYGGRDGCWAGVRPSSAKPSREKRGHPFRQQRLQLWIMMGDGSGDKGHSSTTSPTEILKT